VSDIHCGEPTFDGELMRSIVERVNRLSPDLVVVAGDLTAAGHEWEFEEAARWVELFEPPKIVIPGNHDARNVGYIHFEEMIGPRHWRVELDGVVLVGADSSEPDLDHGQIGRERYAWIAEQFADPADLKIYVQHHHLLPIPGTGRERNIVYDAGDLLELLIRAGVGLSLTGHKHVPYVWRIENLYVANAGTCSSLRLRGNTKPCYNIIEVDRSEVTIHRKLPFGPSSVIAHFNYLTGEEYQREIQSVVREPEPSA
jgi:Icc protein